MTSNCLDCGHRPQDTPYGLCEQCKSERRERVRESLRSDDADSDDEIDVEEARAQGTLDAWTGGVDG